MWLGRRLSPTLAYDYPNIAALARYLAVAPSSSEHTSKVSADTVIVADPIAIIGIGCRFPMANNPEDFWRILHDGVDAITEVPAERWDCQTFYAPNEVKPRNLNT